MTWAIAVLYALDLGASILQVNLITTIWSTMGIFLQVPFGILSDRLGRKPMLLYPTAMTLLGSLMRAFATDPNHLLVAAFVGGFAGGGFFPILLSMVADVVEPEEQKESISTLFFFSSVGMLLGPIICSFLLTLPQINLRNIYQIDAVSQTGILLYIVTRIQETRPRVKKGERVQYREYVSELIRQGTFPYLMAMAFLFFFYNAVMQTYIPIYGRDGLSLSDAEIASFATFRSLAIMLIRFSAATFLTRVPIRAFLVSALALGGVTGLITPLASSYLPIVLVLFLSGASFGATMILGSTLVAMNSTARNRGIANSLYNISQSTGNLTKILTTPLVDSLGFAPVFLLGGVTALMSTAPILLRRTIGQT